MKRFMTAVFIFISALIFSIVGSMEVKTACENLNKGVTEIINKSSDFKILEKEFESEKMIISLSQGTKKKNEIEKLINTAKRLSAAHIEKAKSLLYYLQNEILNIADDETLNLANLL